MSNLKNLFKDTALYGIGKSIQKFIGLFLLPFYASVLGPEEFGVLDTIGVATFFIISVLNCGLDSASGRFFYVAKNPTEKGEVLFTVLVLRLITIIPCLILIPFSAKISIVLFGTKFYSNVVLLSILLIPLTLLYSEQEHVFRYHFEPIKFNITSISKIFTSIVLGLTLVVHFKLGVLGATIATFSSSLVFFFVSFGFFNFRKYTYRFKWHWAKKMLSYGYPLIAATAAIWFYSSSDRFIILYFKDLAEVGIYSIGAKFTQIIALINMAVQMSFGPHMINIFENDLKSEKSVTKGFILSSWKTYLFLSLSLVLFLSVFSENIILLFLNENYITASIVIPFLGFAKILSQSIQMATPGIFFKNKTKYFGIIMPFCALINVVLNIFLIPFFGFAGAAFSTFFIHLVQFCILFLISQKLFSINFNIIRTALYFLIIFSISIIVPLLEIKTQIEILFYEKIGLFLIGMLAPIMLNFFKIKTLKKILSIN